MIPAEPDLDWWLDLASLLLMIGAGLLTLAAALGLLRFPDAMARLHAGTKPQILGLLLMVIAIALQARSFSTLLLLSPILVLQMLIAPVAAQMLSRAAYRTENFRASKMVIDELADSEFEVRPTEIPPAVPPAEPPRAP